MRLLKKETILSLVYIYIYVFQEFWSYCVNSLNIHHPYWMLILTLLGIISIYQLFRDGRNFKLPLFYTIVLVLGAFVSVLNGYTIGFCMLRGLFAIVSLSSLIFITKHRVNPRLFELLLIGAYIYYYYSYFGLLQNIDNKNEFDGDVFVTSSANAISICLNCILFLYFILNKYYKEKNQKRIFFFSLVNIILIVIQGSGAGIIVGLLISLMVLYEIFYNSPSMNKVLLSIAVMLTISVGIFSYLNDITEYFLQIGLVSDAYEKNIRSFAQYSFLHNMDTKSFFIGYPKGEIFAGVDRTFNSYLDLWNRYGFFSFCFFVLLLIRRIVKRNSYAIPFIYFTPILVYAFVETLFAGQLWDMFFMYMLFLSGPDIPGCPERIGSNLQKEIMKHQE